MDNYEVNVLTRKGGWKKLPQEVIDHNVTKKLEINNSDNLNINVTDDNVDSDIPEDYDNNIFENFTKINKIINKLKNVENQKNTIIYELDELMKNFEVRKDYLDKKLNNIRKEQEMYQKAIKLITSLKNS